MWKGTVARWKCFATQASAPRHSTGRRSGSSDAPAAVRPTCAARCSAGARSPGRARRISRCAAPVARERSSSPRSRSGPAFGCRFSTRGATRSRTRKGGGPIADALAAVGARDAVLVFEEQAVMGTTKARANRLANADHANLVRTSRAAQEQIRAVRRLERRGGLGSLPPKLAEMARLRLRYPALSMRELAAKCSPPATKSTAQRRLSRLVQLGEL